MNQLRHFIRKKFLCGPLTPLALGLSVTPKPATQQHQHPTADANTRVRRGRSGFDAHSALTLCSANASWIVLRGRNVKMGSQRATSSSVDRRKNCG
jgi:hypothetical protein